MLTLNHKYINFHDIVALKGVKIAWAMSVRMGLPDLFFDERIKWEFTKYYKIFSLEALFLTQKTNITKKKKLPLVMSC